MTTNDNNDDRGSFLRAINSETDVLIAELRERMRREMYDTTPLFGMLFGTPRRSGPADKFRWGWNVDYSFALFPRFTRLERAIHRRRRKVRWWWRDHVVEAWRVLRGGIDARSDW